MKTVYAVYTGHGLVDPLKQVFQRILPEERLVNVVDDSIIRDVTAAGKVTPTVAQRLLRYYLAGFEMGADVILNTCSSVGEVVERAQFFLPIPIVRIDSAMADAAVGAGDAIGVLATLPTTLDPTMRLLQRHAARKKRDVSLVPALAEGAYEALVGGDPERHDDLILEAARSVADKVDLLVLAQGSMARMTDSLSEASGKPVYSSIAPGMEAVREALYGSDRAEASG